MPAFWETVASNAVLFAVLAVCVTLLGRIWKNPAGLHLLWVLLLVRLFTPPLITAGIPSSIEPPLPNAKQPAAVETVAHRPTVEHITDRRSLTHGTSVRDRVTGDPSLTDDTSAFDALTLKAKPSSFDWVMLLLLAWGIGVAVFAARHAFHVLRLQRLLAEAKSPPDDINRMAARISKRLGLTRVPRIVVLNVRISPLVWWIGGRPLVILPVVLLESLDSCAQQSIVAHELAHVRRRDHLVRALELVASTVYWWHPLMWWACKQLRELEEQCCDAIALDVVPHGARVYATALVDTLDFLSEVPTPMALGTAGAGTSASIARRLEMLNECRAKRLTARSVLVTLAAAVVPMAVGFTSEGQEQSSELPAAVVEPGLIQDRAQGTLDGEIVVAGICDDGGGGVVAGTELVLYQIDWTLRRQAVVARTFSDANGQFQFAPVPGHPEMIEQYGITATSTGRSSQVVLLPNPWSPTGELRLSMQKASVLRGRVMDREKRPVAGAKVWAVYGLPEKVVGVRCAVTDAEGNYAIDDLAEMEMRDWSKPRQLPGGREVMVRNSGPRVYCRHPEFEYTWTDYQSVPGVANFVLNPAGVITGRVVYAETGEPAAGIGVGVQSTGEGDYSVVLTDEQGRYRLESLRAEKYNIWTEAEGWTARAIDAVQAVSGETKRAPDLELVRGGVVTGRLVDADTGKPIRYADFVAPIKERTRPYVAIKGPARPWSGPGQMAAKFAPDGACQFRIPPGESFVLFNPPRPWRLVSPVRRSEPNRGIPPEFDGSIPLLIAEGDDLVVDFQVRMKNDGE